MSLLEDWIPTISKKMILFGEVDIQGSYLKKLSDHTLKLYVVRLEIRI